jgi:hypothetical protein
LSYDKPLLKIVKVFNTHTNNMEASVIDSNGKTAHQRASTSVDIVDSSTAAIGNQT